MKPRVNATFLPYYPIAWSLLYVNQWLGMRSMSPMRAALPSVKRTRMSPGGQNAGLATVRTVRPPL